MRRRQAQRKVSKNVQNAKTTVTDVAKPLQRRAIKRALNPPSHSVMRPILVLGRRICITLALTGLNSGSLIIILDVSRDRATSSSRTNNDENSQSVLVH